MTKKIFKVIAIVLASIIVFVGAVFGIMALMGRFRTPDVYPNRLEFIEDEQTIVYSDSNQDRLYSFVLNGFSDDEEYEVNQKDCYIYFVNNVGADLITLCDQNGNPLQAENNRYLVQCNEYIYYKVNDVSETNFSGSTYGQVVLQGRDARSQVQSSNNLTIWVDRKVTYLSLDYGSSTSHNGQQELQLGVDVSFDFNYKATPDHSLDPISREDGKIVELYYDDPNEADYVPINTSTYSNYPFLSYNNENQKFSFSADTAGTYEFKIAVFATYQEREDYLNSSYVQTDSNFDRISRMVNTTLTINVVNSDISSVTMNSTGINLNLYADNNYITLSGQSGVQGANDNNLGLSMIRDGVPTTIRFNEVDFSLDENTYPDNWSDVNINFVSDDGQRNIIFNSGSVTLSGFGQLNNTYTYSVDTSRNVININGLNDFSLMYTLSNIYVNSSTVLIDSMSCIYESNTITFECANGAAFLQSNADATYNIKLLRSGSYLQFYIYNTQSGLYNYANTFDYTATSINSGETKSWNIVAKNVVELSETESLVLGILVVNNSGGAYFAYAGVSVTPIDLTFSFVDENRTHDLEVNYVRNNEMIFTTVYPELEFDDIINITNGSYDACVFITPREADGIYDIDVVEGMIFTDALNNEYVLVGYIQGDQFVNAVRIREGAVNVGTSIYMLQLQNDYEQSASEYIQSILEDEQNNIVFRYSIQVANDSGEFETKYVNLSWIDGEQVVTSEDVTLNITDFRIENNNLVVTVQGANGNLDYVCEFVSLTRDGQDVCLGNRSQTQTLDPVAEVVNSFISDARRVTINVSYNILTDQINYDYNAFSIDGEEIGGTDAFVNIIDGNIHVVENTDRHTWTLSSNVTNMLQDLYNTGVLDINTGDNMRVYLYSSTDQLMSTNSDAIDFNSLTFTDGNLQLSYSCSSALSNPDSYLRIVFLYNGIEIVSDKIYIESTAATDIYFTYINGTDDSGNNNVYNVQLYDSPETALPTSTLPDFYIRVQIGYDLDANDFTYTYYIVHRDVEIELVDDEIYTKLFNLTSTVTTNELGGFLVNPIINGISHNLSYASNSPSIFDINSSGNVNIAVNKIGSAVLSVSCDDIIRYFAVIIETEEMNLGDSRFNLSFVDGTGEATTDLPSVSLDTFIDYTYNNNGNNVELAINSTNVTLENVSVIQFGGDRDLSVEATSSGFNIVTSDDQTVLEIVGNESGWTFNRISYMYAELIISFDIDVKACETVSFALTFTSSIEINLNSNWSNYYQGTSVFIYEVSETGDTSNEPVFKIKNSMGGTEITAQLAINGEQYMGTINNSEFVFEEVGSYVFTFYYSGRQLDSYTINIVPNVVARINSNFEDITPRFSAGDTHALSDFVTLMSYTTVGKVYGQGSGAIYSETDLEDASVLYSNLSLGLIDNSLISMNSADANFTVAWLENIGEEITENVTVYYRYDVGSVTRNLELLNTDVVLYNRYEISRETQGDNFPDYSDNVYTIMSNISYQSFISILNNADYSLTSIQSNYSDLEFTVDNNTFKLITNLNGVRNDVVLTFTFTYENGGVTRRLIYTTSETDAFAIRLTPLAPDEIDATIYSGASTSVDLLNDLYDLESLLVDLDIDSYLISSMIVTAVDDESLFTNTSFLGSGYIGVTNYGAHAYTSEFNGNSETVNVTYTITYNDGITYTFTRTISIYNRQSVLISSPYQDSTLTGRTSNFVFVGEDAQTDANNLLGVQVQGENVYTITIQTIDGVPYYFEPVNINQTIDMDYDENQSIRRVVIYDQINNNVLSGADFDIELIAYQNNAIIRNYYNSGKIVINEQDNTITFNEDITFASGNYGYFIFKITSESGSVGYYFVYLYNQLFTSYNNVDYTNSFVFNSVGNQSESNYINTENGTFLGYSIDTNFFANNFGANINYSNVDFYLLEADMLEGEFELVDYSTHSKIDEESLPAIDNYTYLKIGMILNSSNTRLYLGNLEVYVLPIYEEVVRQDAEGNAVVLPLINNVETGQYTKTITTDVQEFEIPFTNVNDRIDSGITYGGVWSAEIVEGEDGYTYSTDSISSNGNLIISLNDTTVVFNSYVNNEDLQFSVKYIYTIGDSSNVFVVIVHYTYEQIGIDTNAVSVTVGQFIQSNDDEGVINSYFDNRLDLSTLIGNYNKDLSILNDNSSDIMATIDLAQGTVDVGSDNIITFDNNMGMRYIYDLDNDKHYLEFDQTTSNYTVQFVIQFDDIVDENDAKYTRTITTNVLSGLYVSQPQSGIGQSQDTAMTSTSEGIDNLYLNSTGSRITINSSTNDISGVTRYYVGGLNIYTSKASVLDITFSNDDYINLTENDDGIKIQTVDAEEDVNFVHSAQNQALILYITIRDIDSNTSYQAGGSNRIVNFYVNAIRTYSTILPIYYVKGANHENVINSYIIPNIYNELFNTIDDSNVSDISDTTNTNILNTRRIALVDLSENQITDYDPYNIGFTNPSSPNYINFTTGDNMNMSATEPTLSFTSVDSNRMTNLYISNSAGLTNITYQYQLMSSSEYKDGLDYQIETNSVIGNNEYVAMTITDTTANSSFVYGDTDTVYGQTVMLGEHIASLFDGNNSVFYITNLAIRVEGVNTSNYQVTKLDRVENSNYPDDIVYSIVLTNNNGNSLIITIRLGSGRQLYVGLQREVGYDPFGTLSLTLTMYGDSGNLINVYSGSEFVGRTLEIRFYNYTLESAYSTSYDTIYAGEQVDLSDKISIRSNLPDLSELSLSNAQLVMGTSGNVSSYIITGFERVYISQTNNAIFNYESIGSGDVQRNLIMTKAVGAIANVTLYFRVSDADGYYIGTIQYNFYLRPNFDFRVNGQSMSSGEDEFYTNYILTTNNIGNTGGNTGLNYTENLRVRNNTQNIVYDGTTYSYDLQLQLFTVDGLDEITDVQSIRITEVSNWGTEYVSIDSTNFAINIHKDFTGSLILQLDIDLRENGTYSVLWNINVLGFITLEYPSVNGENNILVQSNGEGFTSGTSVNVISSTSNFADTGIVMSNTHGELNLNPNVTNSFELEGIQVNYVITPFTETINVNSVFENADQINAVDATYNNIFNTNTVSLVLPSVPQSSAPNYDYYNVTYRIEFTYLNQTTAASYVTYKVYNNASISPNAQYTVIDVDNDLINGNYVDMFYFAEVYTDESDNTFTLRLDSNRNIVMDVETSVSAYTGVYSRNDDGTYSSTNGYTIRIETANSAYSIIIMQGVSQVTNYTVTRTLVYDNVYYGTGIQQNEVINRSLFSTEYNSITEFKTFIDSVSSIRLSNMNGFTGSVTSIYFVLEYIENASTASQYANGTFGINLSNPYISTNWTDLNRYDVANNKLFNNELIADLDVMSESNNAIIHIDGYDGTNGFKLTTTNAITAKGQFRVRDMFLANQCNNTSYLNYYVVGVYASSDTPSINWVNNATSYELGSQIGTITVNERTYELYEVTYIGSGDELYNLVTTMYAIASEDDRIVNVDYGGNFQSWFFQVNYMDVDSVLDLNGKFSTYQNDVSGAFTETSFGANGTESLLASLTENSTNDYSNIDINSRTITVTKDTLRVYKNENPNVTLLNLSYTAIYSGVTLTFNVEFQLPLYPFVEITASNTAENLTVSLLGSGSEVGLYIQDAEGQYVELSEENLNLINSIVESSTNYTTLFEQSDGNYTGNIMLNGAMINQYFIDNPNSNQLEILYTLTTGTPLQTQYTLQFRIIVLKPNA